MVLTSWSTLTKVLNTHFFSQITHVDNHERRGTVPLIQMRCPDYYPLSIKVFSCLPVNLCLIVCIDLYVFPVSPNNHLGHFPSFIGLLS